MSQAEMIKKIIYTFFFFEKNTTYKQDLEFETKKYFLEN